MISTMSMRQALEVWNKLHDAYHGEASHGATAEIYAYELAPYDPKANQPAFGEESRDELGRHAARNLCDLLCLFVELNRCVIKIDADRDGMGGYLFKPYHTTIPSFDHRIHVHVVGGEAR